MVFYNDIEEANRRIEKLEAVAEAARVLIADKIIQGTVCFPNTLFGKYSDLQQAIEALDTP